MVNLPKLVLVIIPLWSNALIQLLCPKIFKLKHKISSFISNYGLIIGGLFMLMISGVVIDNGITKEQITKENKIVTVEVIESPNTCKDYGRRAEYWKLKYNETIFIKRVEKKFCQSIINKKELKMLTNKKKNKLLFLNEYQDSNDILFGCILSCIALIIIFKGYTIKKII